MPAQRFQWPWLQSQQNNCMEIWWEGKWAVDQACCVGQLIVAGLAQHTANCAGWLGALIKSHRRAEPCTCYFHAHRSSLRSGFQGHLKGSLRSFQSEDLPGWAWAV